MRVFNTGRYVIVLTAVFTVIFIVCRVDALGANDGIGSLSARGFEICGSGEKRYFGFRLWRGHFYLEKEAPAREALSDVAKRLEIEYLLRIPAAEIARATEIGVKNNVPEPMYQQVKDRVALANSLWPDVKEGDRYEVTYLPGQGTAFVFNGKLQGVIEGQDFAFAFFSIWVGENPIDRKLSRQLLACP